MDEEKQTTPNNRADEMLVWQAPEHPIKERGADWFLIVGIVAGAVALSAIIYDNLLFAVLIVVAAFALILFAIRTPETITFSLTPKALMIGSKKYPFSIFESFWVSEEENGARLILQSDQLLMHHLVVPLEGADSDAVREYLTEHLPEEEIYEPLSHQIMEYLGF